jgi:hypothetical protein
MCVKNICEPRTGSAVGADAVMMVCGSASRVVKRVVGEMVERAIPAFA